MTLASLRRRHERMGELLRECELLKRTASLGFTPAAYVANIASYNPMMAERVRDRLVGHATLSDVIPAMIREREQALADLGLREPGVPHPRYSAPLEPGYPLDRPTPWFEKYPILERLRAYAANEEPRIPATLAEEGHCE